MKAMTEFDPLRTLASAATLAMGREQRMDMDDERWSGLEGGYRVAYDPRAALGRLARGDDPASAWDELWNELHHQGDIGLASFAAVPELVRIHQVRGVADWNTYALAATIEDARANPDNPALPNWLRPEYEQAWRNLFQIALTEIPAATEDDLVHSIIAVIAFAKGRRSMGRTAMLTEDEREELLGEVGWG